MQTSDWDEVSSKVVALVERFSMVCCTPPTHEEIGLITNFWSSKVKLPIWLPTLLLAITYVLDVQMGHASPFQTCTFQDLFNVIRSASIQWVLTPTIALWIFGNPFRTWTPKMGVHLGVWGFTPSHSFALMGAWDVTLRLLSWLTTLQVFALVMNPRLGLWQKRTSGSCLFCQVSETEEILITMTKFVSIFHYPLTKSQGTSTFHSSFPHQG
jgi:hypothetical protein